jgi:hypothetical protein
MIHAMLAAQREAAIPEVRINQDFAARTHRALRIGSAPERIAPATLDGLLALRGAVESIDAAEDEAGCRARESASRCRRGYRF